MANTKQARKRILVTAQKRLRNMAVRSSVKTAFKKAQGAVEAQTEQSKEAVLDAIKTMDKAACKGIIHKNTAARKKSRLMKRLNSALADSDS